MTSPDTTAFWGLYILQTAVSSAFPDSKVHGANIGPIWGRQDPGGPHVGPMNLTIWVVFWERFRRWIQMSPLFVWIGSMENKSSLYWRIKYVSTCKYKAKDDFKFLPIIHNQAIYLFVVRHGLLRKPNLDFTHHEIQLYEILDQLISYFGEYDTCKQVWISSVLKYNQNVTGVCFPQTYSLLHHHRISWNHWNHEEIVFKTNRV